MLINKVSFWVTKLMVELVFFYSFPLKNEKEKFHLTLLTWGWEIKCFTLTYKLEVEKQKVIILITNLMGKLLLFHFRDTNLKLKIRKFHLQLLIQKIKKTNLDFKL